MTQGSFAFSKFLLASIFTMAAAGPAFAFAPASLAKATVMSAEICNSNDGRYMSIRTFGEVLGTLIAYNPDPTKKPAMKHGFTFNKEPGGVTRKNDVTLEMFELMAEPFGATLQPRMNWKRAYEILFVGRVTVIDDQAKVLGTLEMSCNSAMVEYL